MSLPLPILELDAKRLYEAFAERLGTNSVPFEHLSNREREAWEAVRCLAVDDELLATRPGVYCKTCGRVLSCLECDPPIPECDKCGKMLFCLDCDPLPCPDCRRSELVCPRCAAQHRTIRLSLCVGESK